MEQEQRRARSAVAQVDARAGAVDLRELEALKHEAAS
jgi:hypothetical protein